MKYDAALSEDTPATEAQRSLLRGVAGSCCWLARQTRPGLSYEVSRLQQRFGDTLTIKDIKEASLMAQRTRREGMKLHIPSLDLKSVMVLNCTDASPGTMPRSGSQGGLVMFMADRRCLEKTGNVAVAGGPPYSFHGQKSAAANFFWQEAHAHVAADSMASALLAATAGWPEAGRAARAACQEVRDPLAQPPAPSLRDALLEPPIV